MQSVTHEKENTKQSNANSTSKYVAKKVIIVQIVKKWNKIRHKNNSKIKMVKKLCA